MTDDLMLVSARQLLGLGGRIALRLDEWFYDLKMFHHCLVASLFLYPLEGFISDPNKIQLQITMSMLECRTRISIGVQANH